MKQNNVVDEYQGYRLTKGIDLFGCMCFHVYSEKGTYMGVLVDIMMDDEDAINLFRNLIYEGGIESELYC